MLVLDILKTEKSRLRDRFISYSKHSRRGTLFIQKTSGICSVGNRKLGFACWLYLSRWPENVRCRCSPFWSAHIAKEDTHTVSNTVQNSLPNPLLLLQMVRKQHILLFLKCFKFILPCLRRSSVMKKSNTLFNEIFLLSVYKENRAVFPFCRKIGWQSSKAFQKVNYVTCLIYLCISCVVISYRISKNQFS